MHHKRNRSVSREIRRMDQKSYRQNEARAIDSINDAPPNNPRVHRYGYRPEALPLGDIPCNGKRHSKRKRPKKERCPSGGAHQWYKEWVTREDFLIRWERCLVCAEQGIAGYNWGCWSHSPRIKYTERRYIATCINCFTEKTLKVDSDAHQKRYSNYYGRKHKLVLPKRPVKF